MSEQVIPANWYADPDNPAQLRWWDGSAWTSHYSPLPTPIAEEPTEASPASRLKVFVPQGLLDRAADIAQGIENKASDLRTTGSAMVSAAMAARNDKPEGDARITRVPPMPAGPPEALVGHTAARMPTNSVPDVPVPSANLGEVEYTSRTVRTFRAMEGRTRAKLEQGGWEFVSRIDAPMLRSELTFRRLKNRVPRWAVVAGASVAAIAVLAIVLGSVAAGQKPPVADPEPARAVATPSPTPSAEATDPPASPVPPSLVTDAEVVAAFTNFFNERSADGVVIAKSVSDVTFKDGTVRVTFDASKAGITQELFDSVNPFPNLSKFVASPVAFNDDLGNRIRPSIVSIETVTADGSPLGSYSHAELLSLNGLSH